MKCFVSNPPHPPPHNTIFNFLQLSSLRIFCINFSCDYIGLVHGEGTQPLASVAATYRIIALGYKNLIVFKNVFSPSQTNFWLVLNLVFIRSAGIPAISTLVLLAPMMLMALPLLPASLLLMAPTCFLHSCCCSLCCCW